MLTVDSHSFTSEVLGAGIGKKVVVKFYADWCGPCLVIAPKIDQIASEHPDVKFVAVDVDKSPDLCEAYGVMGIPALILFSESERLQTFAGGPARIIPDLQQALA